MGIGESGSFAGDDPAGSGFAPRALKVLVILVTPIVGHVTGFPAALAPAQDNEPSAVGTPAQLGRTGACFDLNPPVVNGVLHLNNLVRASAPTSPQDGRVLSRLVVTIGTVPDERNEIVTKPEEAARRPENQRSSPSPKESSGA
jgi:hypothetical protein